MIDPDVPPIVINGRPVHPIWGKYLDVPDEFLNEVARHRYEQYRRVLALFPVLPEWRSGMPLPEWQGELYRLNPEARFGRPPGGEPERTYSPKAPIDGASAIAQAHEAALAEARDIKETLRELNESGDSDGAARLRVPSHVRRDDWGRA
jgi:hypothetical protein